MKTRAPEPIKPMQPILICMRLVDMRRVHPNQIEGTCSCCGTVVGIYPSGQTLLQWHPETKIICQVCHRQSGDRSPRFLAPGAEFEPAESKWRK